jgi:hypothetical protein
VGGKQGHIVGNISLKKIDHTMLPFDQRWPIQRKNDKNKNECKPNAQVDEKGPSEARVGWCAIEYSGE